MVGNWFAEAAAKNNTKRLSDCEVDDRKENSWKCQTFFFKQLAQGFINFAHLSMQCGGLELKLKFFFQISLSHYKYFYVLKIV